MNDRIIGSIRTGVPVLWGLALAWLISRFPHIATALDWLTEQLGADARHAIGLFLTAVVVALYYWVIRTMGERFPSARPWIERYGLGSSKTPTYLVPARVIDRDGNEIQPDADGIVTLPVDDDPKHLA